jgi:hypothetical protein
VPVVARAYADQLDRSEALMVEHRSALEDLLQRAEAGESGGDLTEAMLELAGAFRDQAAGSEGATRKRFNALAETLSDMARSTI